MPSFSRRKLLRALAGSTIAAPNTVRAERKQVDHEYFEMTRLEIWLTSLDPAHDGMVLGQLSDLHIGNGVPDGRVISAVRAMNEAAPDLVMLTGDFVTTKRDPTERVPQLLGSLKAPSYAVLGNHDHWSHPTELRTGLEKVGMTVLQNENTHFRHRGVDFTVIGVDDSTTQHDDVDRAFKGATKGSRVVLTHTPACAQKLPAWEDVLCLSGHTHGGHWDVPGLTSGLFKRVGQPWYRGYYPVRGNQLFVNRGLGFGKGTRLPRINSDPELTLLTLRRLEP